MDNKYKNAQQRSKKAKVNTMDLIYLLSHNPSSLLNTSINRKIEEQSEKAIELIMYNVSIILVYITYRKSMLKTLLM